MSLVEEIGYDIWKITLRQPYNENVHCYLIKREKITLIDVGHNSPISYFDLVNGLKLLNLNPIDIEQIILTHSHIDHYGGLVYSDANFNARIFGYKGFNELMNNIFEYLNLWKNIPHEISKHCPELKSFIYGNSDFYNNYFNTSKTFNINVELFERDIIDLGNDELEVIYTPGHSNDHLCLLHKSSGYLFSGDVVLDYGPPLVSLTNDDIDKFLKSLDSLNKLFITKILPGHGNVISTPKQAITNSINRVINQMEQIYDAISAGSNTLLDIALKIGKDQTKPSIILNLSIILTYLISLEKRRKIRIFRNDAGAIENIKISKVHL